MKVFVHASSKSFNLLIISLLCSLSPSTPLMIAAAEGRIALIKLLAENKADPEINDNNMFKAIDYAVTRNHPE